MKLPNDVVLTVVRPSGYSSDITEIEATISFRMNYSRIEPDKTVDERVDRYVIPSLIDKVSAWLESARKLLESTS